MTENKRFEYWKDSDTAYDTKIKYGQYFRIIDKKDMVHLLNEQEKRIKNLKETIIKITIAYQRKHDSTIVNLVNEVWEEDISDLTKNGDVE